MITCRGYITKVVEMPIIEASIVNGVQQRGLDQGDIRCLPYRDGSAAAFVVVVVAVVVAVSAVVAFVVAFVVVVVVAAFVVAAAAVVAAALTVWFCFL